MARAATALAFCLLLALAAAAPSPYSEEEEQQPEADSVEAQSAEEALAEEQRLGQEAQLQDLDDEQWQAEDAQAAVSVEDEQGDDAVQEEYRERDNAEQQTQQLQNTQQVVEDLDEGTLDRLNAEPQGEQQSGQLVEQSGQLVEQSGQLQQQSGQLTQQQGGLPERIQEQPQPGDNPPRRQPGDNPPNTDFGFVTNDGVRPPQEPASSGASSGARGFRPPTPPGRPQPPAGYTTLGSYGHFKVFTTPLTWPEALMTCAADGAILAIPNSEDEAKQVGGAYAKIKNQVKKSQDRDLFFIGVSDLHKEGSFTTLLGKTFKQGQWHKWQKGEPNNHKKIEHCVLSNDQGFYWDGNCQAKYAFVCQFVDRCLTVTPYANIQQSSDLQQQTQTRY